MNDKTFTGINWQPWSTAPKVNHRGILVAGPNESDKTDDPEYPKYFVSTFAWWEDGTDGPGWYATESGSWYSSLESWATHWAEINRPEEVK